MNKTTSEIEVKMLIEQMNFIISEWDKYKAYYEGIKNKADNILFEFQEFEQINKNLQGQTEEHEKKAEELRSKK